MPRSALFVSAGLLALLAALPARAQMNMNLFNDKPAESAPTAAPVAAPAAAQSAPEAAQTGAVVPAPQAVSPQTTAPVAAAAAPAATANDTTAVAAPVPAAPATSAAATPSCPAGKNNPAADQAARPNLPASLQKLYNLRLPSFTAADLNCDGFLDTAELQAMIDKKFAVADTNGDGSISAEEAKGIISDFDESAANTPGVIAGPREVTLKHRLSIMDTNQDSVISRAEYEAYFQARYQKLDRDGNGKLDITEYQTDDEDNRRVRGSD